MKGDTERTRRLNPIVGMLVMAAVGLVVLPSRADGQRSAYVAFAIAFVVSVIVGTAFHRLHVIGQAERPVEDRCPRRPTSHHSHPLTLTALGPPPGNRWRAESRA